MSLLGKAKQPHVTGTLVLSKMLIHGTQREAMNPLMLQAPAQSTGAVIKDSSSIKIETIIEAETAIDMNKIAIEHGIAPVEMIRGTVKGIEDERVLLLSRFDSVQVTPYIYKFISRNYLMILSVTPQFSCCHSEQLSLALYQCSARSYISLHPSKR